MIRKIIHIDEDKCNGCGACVSACHEGAIGLVDGKAKLLRDDYCDGLGDCLPTCPTGAISFIEREAAAYNEAAVLANQQKRQTKGAKGQSASLASQAEPDQVAAKNTLQADVAAGVGGNCISLDPGIGNSGGCKVGGLNPAGRVGGCPGKMARAIKRQMEANSDTESFQATVSGHIKPIAQLAQWPCQIRLVPIKAPYFQGAKLLIAADCTAYAYANIHQDFMKGKVTIIGCPKLDPAEYVEKLQQIIANNDIKSVTVLRMEVPCCGGLEQATITALKNSGKFIPWQVVTISVDGRILEQS